MSRKAFDKFINKESGAKKKEKIRQEKKKVRAEKNAWFDEQKRLAREKRYSTTSEKDTTRGNRTSGPKPAVVKTNSRPASDKPLNRNTTKPTGPTPVIKKKSTTSTKGFQPGAEKAQKPSTATKSVTKTTESKAVHNTRDAKVPEDVMALNKFIAWSGVCGRREAVDLIKSGKVVVNGQTIKEPPFRVSQQDLIKVNGKKISLQKNLVYILLNKPKDYITTTDDPEGRKTVMDLIKNATPERVFPVGRLDRNTTGVLLLTNDGEVAQRLTHPKYEVKKIYEVKLDKAVTKQQLDIIASGITLEDGFIQPDAVAYADTKDKSVIGIEIHSGRNRIVRRIFEHLGFDVRNLDRVMYGIFTKKNVDRGKWRFLSEKEIRLLKHLNTSFSNKKTTR